MAINKLITPDIFLAVVGCCILSIGITTSIPPNKADKTTTASPKILNHFLHKLPES